MPQLNALLEAALPPGAALQRLVLWCCNLTVASLRRLPALAGLLCLELRRCRSRGGVDAPLQALVQLAPALTSLHFEAPSSKPAEPTHVSYCLRSCPAYLLAHPSLRSVVVLNRQLAEWDLEEALRRLPSVAAAQPGGWVAPEFSDCCCPAAIDARSSCGCIELSWLVSCLPHLYPSQLHCHPHPAVLEHLTTDGFTFMPPALAAVTSLRSLAFLDQPQFEFTGDTVDLALALPHLTSLTLPKLTGFEQQAVERLRLARPGLSLQVQPKEHCQQEGQGEQGEGAAGPCVIS